MRAVRYLLPILLPFEAAVAIGAPPNAGSAPPEIICVGSPRWSPTLDDTRHVTTSPIPESYRRTMTEPCFDWDSGETALLDWHLRFGTGGSTAAALGFVEAERAGPLSRPKDYPVDLRRAYMSAAADLRRAARVVQPLNVNYSARSRFMDTSKTIRRLNDLLRTRKTYIGLAASFLHAAEELQDAAMLDKADLYLAPAVDGAAFLGPLEAQPPVRDLLYYNLATFRTDDLRARAALLRARLTGRLEDVDHARLILKEENVAGYDHVAAIAYSGGSGFCDIGAGLQDAQEVASRCDREPEFGERVFALALNHAMLDLIVSGSGSPGVPTSGASFDVALRLLSLAGLPGFSRPCCQRDYEAEKHRLFESKAHFLMQRPANRDDESTARTNRLDALSALQRAERLASPDEAPSRFQRDAAEWLGIWQARGPSPVADAPDLLRHAAYLDVTLNNLSSIRAGATDR